MAGGDIYQRRPAPSTYYGHVSEGHSVPKGVNTFLEFVYRSSQWVRTHLDKAPVDRHAHQIAIESFLIGEVWRHMGNDVIFEEHKIPAPKTGKILNI